MGLQWLSIHALRMDSMEISGCTSEKPWGMHESPERLSHPYIGGEPAFVRTCVLTQYCTVRMMYGQSDYMMVDAQT